MRKKLIQMLTACLLVATSARASTNVFNFDSDPSALLTVFRSGDNPTATALAGVWFPTNGSTLEVGADPSTNGFFAITQVGGGHRAVIIFDDFDNGLVVAGFKFQADVRIGAGTDNPADGFSLNYARATDPVIVNNDGSGFASSPGGEGNLPEEGTQTGLAICFDAWDSGSGDVIGLTIRVDNVIRTNIPLPTLNGACGDVTSMQTGPNTFGAISNLCWQPLYAELTTDGKLHVSYKGAALLTNYAVNFAPSPGRLIFGGRVGGANQQQHVDNIRLVTIPSSKPVVGPTTANANGFRVTISDSGNATPDTNTITLKLDGASLTPTLLTQSGGVGIGNGVTLVMYQNTGLILASGSTHTNIIHFTGSTFGGAVDVTNVFTVPVYTLLTPSHQAPAAVNTSLGGLAARVHQLPVARFPSATSVTGIERQMADGFIDPSTGLPYASITFSNNWTGDVVNWEQNAALAGAEAGIFQSDSLPPADWGDEQIPGVDTANTDNIAAEILTILDLPVGSYQLGVNHDDAFELTAGAEPRDLFGATVLATDGGANDNAGINLVVTNAGKYPIRLAWGEAGGGAQLEFYLVDFATGQKILINNRTNPVQITAYRDLAALTRPYVRWAFPAAGETGVNPGGTIIVKFEDGTAATITDGSIQIKLNGTSLPVSIANSGTTTTATANHSTVPSGSTNTLTLIYSTSAGGPFTNSWTFTAATYNVLPTDLVTAIGTGDNSQRGFVVQANQVTHGNGNTENNNEVTESQLAGLYAPNLADLSGVVSNDLFFVTTWINWNRGANDGSSPPGENGNFRSAGGYPEDPLPGVTASSGGAGTTFESVAEGVQTYVEFPTPGFYQFGVNSDDNFRLSISESAPPPVFTISGPTNTALACLSMASDPREDNGNRTRFGVPPPTVPLTAPIVYLTPGGADDPGPYPSATGKIVLLDRGGSNLGTTSTGGKVKAAQDLGAVGVIFTTPDASYGGYAGATRTDITVPVLCIPHATAASLLKSYLTNAIAVTGTIRGNPNFVVSGADYGKGDSDVLAGIFVQQAGVYPMRMAFHQGGGGGNCEFFSAKSDGTRVLLNDTAKGGLKTYRVRTAPLRFNAPKVSGGVVTFTWTGIGTLQQATALTGSPSDWSNVYPQGSSSGNTYTVAATGNRVFLRLKQ